MEPRAELSEESGLVVTADHLAEMASHCLGCYPEEGCGLLVGDGQTGEVTGVYPVENVAHSAQVYTLDPKTHLRLDREAEETGRSVIGVFHSHTHTDPWPSPTDVAQAPDPTWHYVIVSLRHELPSTRSYRIVEEAVTEELVTVTGH